MKILSDFVEEMNAELTREMISLANGGAKSFDEYQKRCGRIAGIKHTVDSLISFVKAKPIEDRDMD